MSGGLSRTTSQGVRRVRVPWDGPDPQIGEYVRNRSGVVNRIRSVVPIARPDQSGARLVLDLALVEFAPQGAVIHPHSRMAVTDTDGPARVRQLAGNGPNAVMKTTWRDPDDNRVNVRQPRQITAYRVYCPLRRMAQQKGSQVDMRHIAAADMFRLHADAAKHGFAAIQDMSMVRNGYGPVSGPPARAFPQTVAAAEVSRVMRRLTAGQQDMLIEVVLRNRSIYAWCGASPQARHDPKIEMGRLLGILDILADHYQTEIETELRREGVTAVG